MTARGAEVHLDRVILCSLDMTVKAALLDAGVVVTRKYPGTLSLGVMQKIGMRAFSGSGEEFTISGNM